MSQWSVPVNSHSHNHNHSQNQNHNHSSDHHFNPPSPTKSGSPSQRNSYVAPTPYAAVDGSIDPTASSSPAPRRRTGSRTGSRPTSMVQTFQPPLMEVAQDTLPELQPIFTFLNSHSNKLYQEGYFLKLHDLDSRGRPHNDRSWQECFAQLVGTVLSIWDASQLDVAGDNGQVTPTFINLADASIKMIESLPMNEHGGQTLQNILSLSTAANNRYLLHFSSYNSLTQWTAGIRLALLEHATLQEAYTGSLIAGKGKSLNSIRTIMERSRTKHEDWARVRFGAGTPWRRCWFVVTPPDEKEYQKLQKSLKKASPYEKLPVLKGDLKFYESKKITKRTKPIATIKDAFSAYSIYPQSKPLIDQSTLVKIEGKITIHGSTDSITDGFVFVMPEVHPAVSGFEIMLRFLFPVWDTFALYGRPSRLVADVRDARGLMFALPKERRYGYLECLDVVNLIHIDGSGDWTEKEWRKRLKELTAKRMLVMADEEGSESHHSKATASRTSLPPARNGRLRFDDPSSGRSTPGVGTDYRTHRRAETDLAPDLRHRRSASEALGFERGNARGPQTGPAYDDESPPVPPHRDPVRSQRPSIELQERYETGSEGSGKDSGEKTPDRTISPEVLALAQHSPPPQPVAAPPTMAHAPSQRPQPRPLPPADMRRDHAELDRATLSQIQEVSQMPNRYGAPPQAPPIYTGGPGDHRANHQYGAAYADRSRGQADPQRDQNSMHASQGQRQYANPSPNRGRYGTQRLATIPASPYVDQAASPANMGPAASYFASQGQPGVIDEHRQVQPVTPSHTSGSSVQRKPVPATTPPAGSRPSTADERLDSDPKLASVDQPRMGQMKTVGTVPDLPRDVVIGDAHYSPGPSREQNPDIPDVNFGPTYNLDPSKSYGPPIGQVQNYPRSSEDLNNLANPPSFPPEQPPHARSHSNLSDGSHGYDGPYGPPVGNPMAYPRHRAPVPAYSFDRQPQQPQPRPGIAPNGGSYRGLSHGSNGSQSAGPPVYAGRSPPPDYSEQIKPRDPQQYGQRSGQRMAQTTPNSSFRGNAPSQGQADRWF